MAAIAAMLSAGMADTLIAQDRPGISMHTAAPLILSPDVTDYVVPLGFQGFNAIPVAQVKLSEVPSGTPLRTDPSEPIRVVASVDQPTSGPYAGQKVTVLRIEAARVVPRTVGMDLMDAQGAVLALVRIPLAAPVPQVSRVEYEEGGVAANHLAVRPQEQVRTRLRLRGGPFLPGARIELPRPFVVTMDPVTDPATLTATVLQPARPLYEIPVGELPLKLANEVGGEARTLVRVQGPQPRILQPTDAVTVSDQSIETFKFDIPGLADSARIELSPAAGAAFPPVSVQLGDVSGETVTFSADLPARAGASVLARVVNPDNNTGETVVRLLPAQAATLKIQGTDRLVPGVPAALSFEPQNPAQFQFTGSGGEYALSVGSQSVTLLEPVIDPRKTVLRATVVLPQTLASEAGDVVRAVRLTGDGLARGGLDGLVTVGALPMIESPRVVRLRPGESRTVPVLGKRLANVEFRGTDAVRVARQELKQETGSVTMEAVRTARVGAEERVEGFQGVPGAGIVVRVVPWLDHPVLESNTRFRSGPDEAFRKFAPGDTLSVSPGRELRFQVDAISDLSDEGELVRAQIQKEGAVVWQDSVLALPDKPTLFQRGFVPGTVFEPGQEFSLTLTSQGGAFVQQRFRTRYERGLVCLRCAKVHTGLAAVQMPVGGRARDRFSDGVFNGVTVGLSLPWDAVANRFKGDYVQWMLLLSASDPPSIADDQSEEGEEGEEGGAAVGSARFSRAAQDEDEAERLAFGMGLGFLFFDGVFLTLGWDDRGDGFQEGLHLSFGGSMDLTSIPGLLRRR
ncbi:MAG TPA: hypothetical protein VF615_10725 [Longimicrobiaceae bacterium]|jgi:hypothetical protein